MAQPAYIITPNYYEDAAVSDVQTILNTLDTILAANGWTVAAPGGPYTTPVDPWGRWFKLSFGKISATQLNCSMTDDQLRTAATKSLTIVGTQPIRYYYGTRYLYIENGGQESVIYASLLSLAPESETTHNAYCIFFGSRNSGGTLENYLCGAINQIRLDTNTYPGQGIAPTTFTFLNFGSYAASNYIVNTSHVSGARRWYPAWVIGQDTAGTYSLRGRIYNILLMYSSVATIGVEYTVPIDEATTGVFRVLRMGANGNNVYYMAVRKS